MREDENKKLLHEFIETCLNGRDLGRIEEYVVESFTDHTRPPGTPAGRDSERDSLAEIHSAFDPVHFEIHEVVAEGDRMFARSTFSGTQVGEFMGMPSAGKSFSVAAFDEFRVTDGKLSDHWGLIDVATFMAQLQGGGQ